MTQETRTELAGLDRSIQRLIADIASKRSIVEAELYRLNARPSIDRADAGTFARETRNALQRIIDDLASIEIKYAQQVALMEVYVSMTAE